MIFTSFICINYSILWWKRKRFINIKSPFFKFFTFSILIIRFFHITSIFPLLALLTCYNSAIKFSYSECNSFYYLLSFSSPFYIIVTYGLYEIGWWFNIFPDEDYFNVRFLIFLLGSLSNLLFIKLFDKSPNTLSFLFVNKYFEALKFTVLAFYGMGRYPYDEKLKRSDFYLVSSIVLDRWLGKLFIRGSLKSFWLDISPCFVIVFNFPANLSRKGCLVNRFSVIIFYFFFLIKWMDKFSSNFIKQIKKTSFFQQRIYRNSMNKKKFHNR